MKKVESCNKASQTSIDIEETTDRNIEEEEK